MPLLNPLFPNKGPLSSSVSKLSLLSYLFVVFFIRTVTKAVLTGVVVQLPSWIAAVLGESISTNTLAGGLVQNPVGPAESQQTRVQHIWKPRGKKVKKNKKLFSLYAAMET